MKKIDNKFLKYIFLIIASLALAVFFTCVQELKLGNAYQTVKPGNLIRNDKSIISDNFYESAKFENEFLQNIVITLTGSTSDKWSNENDKNDAKEVLKDVNQIKFFIENRKNNEIYTNTKSKSSDEFKSKESGYCNIDINFSNGEGLYIRNINNAIKQAKFDTNRFNGLWDDDNLSINMIYPKEPSEYSKDKYFYEGDLLNFYNDFKYNINIVNDLITTSIVSGAIGLLALILYSINKSKLFKKQYLKLSKIPIEIYIGFICIAGYYSSMYFSYIPSITIKFAFILLVLMFISYVNTFNEKKNILKNSLIAKLYSYTKKLGINIKKNIKKIPLISRLIIIGISSIVVISFIMLILYTNWYWQNSKLTLVICILVPSCLISFIVLYFIKQIIYINEIIEGADKIKNGEVNHKIEIKGNNNFTVLAENINNISQGLDNAIEAKVKSERMKSELITNVSHDLKTPLTAIINYIGLIKKEENIQPDYLKDYVNILDKKSKRLKLLIDDLFEASKASSGNISFNIEKLDINQLLKQSIGENEEKLTKSNLDIKLKLPEEKVYINCDGKRMYRVFENLLSNISKYSLENTRVYIETKVVDDNVYIYMKNIASYELNFEADEISERFKRGDLSRNTEGSGLGLAIAKDLVELQQGEFNIEIEADLFKVELIFKKS